MSIISCTTNDDCDFNFYCNTDLECTHDPLWPPNVLDIITYILISIIVGIGNVGGMGGGVVKVPMLILMLNYQSKVATFISYCILFGSCLANSTLLIFTKHPNKDKPIIDYNIALIINPMVHLGTNLGIFLNILLPEIAAGILFIIFLMIISPFLFKKGLNLYRTKKKQQKIDLQEQLLSEENMDIQKQIYNKELNGQLLMYEFQNQKENQKINEINAYTDINDLINQNEIQKQYIQEIQEVESILPQKHIQKKPIQDFQTSLSKSQLQESYIDESRMNIDAKENEELKEFYKEEYKQIPWKKLILLIIIFFSVQMLVFLRGGKGLKSFVGITSCSTSYWIVNASIVIIVFIAFCVIRFYLLIWETQKKTIIEKYSLQKEFEGDFDCTNKISYLKTSLAGLTAGSLAGTFGVGAGLALVPILLAAGVHPQVVAATCGFNNFFISITTIIQVFTNGYLDIYQIILFSILSFIGGFVFAKIIYAIVEKKKASYLVVFIVFSLAILNIFSFIVYLTQKGVKHGWDSLVNQTPFCQAQ